jgi:adenosine deaminase
MVRDIRAEDPAFPIDPDALQCAYPITDRASFFNWWSFTRAIDGELMYFHPILRRYVEHLKAQHVVYAEIMIGSGELPTDTAEAIDKILALRDAAGLTRHDNSAPSTAGEIQVEFLVAVGRNKPPEIITERARRILKLYEAGLIVGIALAGIEPGYPIKPFTETLAKLHEAGLGIEIHAGEWGGSAYVWDALHYGYPDRIGHGVSLFEDPKLIEHFQTHQIHIEMCPTSNLKTGSVSHIEAHPIKHARDLGLNFSVNTDDPGIFECSLETEYALLANSFGFDARDFQAIYENALSARFQIT